MEPEEFRQDEWVKQAETQVIRPKGRISPRRAMAAVGVPAERTLVLMVISKLVKCRVEQVRVVENIDSKPPTRHCCKKNGRKICSEQTSNSCWRREVSEGKMHIDGRLRANSIRRLRVFGNGSLV